MLAITTLSFDISVPALAAEAAPSTPVVCHLVPRSRSLLLGTSLLISSQFNRRGIRSRSLRDTGQMVLCSFIGHLPKRSAGIDRSMP